MFSKKSIDTNPDEDDETPNNDVVVEVFKTPVDSRSDVELEPANVSLPGESTDKLDSRFDADCRKSCTVDDSITICDDLVS